MSADWSSYSPDDDNAGRVVKETPPPPLLLLVVLVTAFGRTVTRLISVGESTQQQRNK